VIIWDNQPRRFGGGGGPIVSAVIARERDVPIGEISTYRPRAPYKPITSARSPG
jgi:hypothetical protein